MAEIAQPVLADPAESAVAIATLPGHVTIMRASDLSAEQKGNLTDIHTAFKVSLKGINSAPCTEAEVAAILNKIFYHWASDEYHQFPDQITTKAGMNDKCVEVGILNSDHPSEREIKNALQERGVTGIAAKMKSRATKHLVADYGVKTKNENRKTGCHVYIRAKLGSNRVAEVEFIDKRGNFLGPAPSMSWLNGVSETNAYYRAFRSYDRYETTRFLKYNEEVAIFIARNRITHWCNGNPPHTRPRKEPFQLISPVNTIRDATNVSGGGDVDALNEALGRLRAHPAYSLFPGIPDVDRADRHDRHDGVDNSPHGGSNNGDDNDDDDLPPAGPSRAGTGSKKPDRQANNEDDNRVYQEKRPKRREVREGRELHSQHRRELRQRFEQQQRREQIHMVEVRRLAEARERHERQERQLADMVRQGHLYGGDNRIAFPGQAFPAYEQQFNNGPALPGQFSSRQLQQYQDQHAFRQGQQAFRGPYTLQGIFGQRGQDHFFPLQGQQQRGFPLQDQQQRGFPIQGQQQPGFLARGQQQPDFSPRGQQQVNPPHGQQQFRSPQGQQQPAVPPGQQLSVNQRAVGGEYRNPQPPIEDEDETETAGEDEDEFESDSEGMLQ